MEPIDVPRTLLVTNDYPPRVGGIQRTLENMVKQFPHDRVTVLAPGWEGWREHDAAQPYPIYRWPALLWPHPDLLRKVRSIARETGTEAVVFGASLPAGPIGPSLAKDDVPYLVGAHGVEYWLALVPGTASLLRYATSRAARVSVMCSAFVGRTVRAVVPDRVPVTTAYPGADVDRFHPALDGEEVRERHGLIGRPLVVCVSRLVPRKGQDVLIRAMPAIRRRVPDAALLIVGRGPYRDRLQRMAAGAPPHTVFFSGEVPEDELPLHYAAGDMFAMPCRTRLGGLEVEGWGNVFIEAAACGKPVVAGDSGGAAEAVRDGETGLVVNGRHIDAVAEAVAGLLADPSRAHAMGKAGRARVERSFTWPRFARQLAHHLREAVK